MKLFKCRLQTFPRPFPSKHLIYYIYILRTIIALRPRNNSSNSPCIYHRVTCQQASQRQLEGSPRGQFATISARSSYHFSKDVVVRVRRGPPLPWLFLAGRSRYLCRPPWPRTRSYIPSPPAGAFHLILNSRDRLIKHISVRSFLTIYTCVLGVLATARRGRAGENSSPCMRLLSAGSRERKSVLEVERKGMEEGGFF